VQALLPKRFGLNLKQARERHDLSQAELGRRSGISQTEISRIEAGLREPMLTTIVLLATALNLDGSDLLGDIQ